MTPTPHRAARPGLTTALLLFLTPPVTAGIDFDREVRPILAEYCYTCHGPDEAGRKARFRLDQDSAALGERSIIVRGHPGESELIERACADDPDIRMPPARTGKRLSPAQVDALRRWIDEGAAWSKHWSFVPPRRPLLPQVKAVDRVRNPIDRFVLARLEREGLSPSPEADRATLLRRVTLDLT